MGRNTGGAQDVLPQGESLVRALKWLSQRRQDEPDAKAAKLISEASLRFDLNPMEEQFLLENWKKVD